MDTIATEEELLAFAQSPDAERKITDRLKGVLAETAVTGRIRFQWPLLRPLVAYQIEHVLRDYEAEAQLEVGPSRPLPMNETIKDMIERFKKTLFDFEQAPWTFQRLSEVLLEPQKQYSKLHKVALAIEKLLLVTTEVTQNIDLPPPPPLSTLANVNDNPPKIQLTTTSNNGSGRKRQREDEPGAGLATAALRLRATPDSTSGTSDANHDMHDEAALLKMNSPGPTAEGPLTPLQSNDTHIAAQLPEAADFNQPELETNTNLLETQSQGTSSEHAPVGPSEAHALDRPVGGEVSVDTAQPMDVLIPMDSRASLAAASVAMDLMMSAPAALVDWQEHQVPAPVLAATNGIVANPVIHMDTDVPPGSGNAAPITTHHQKMQPTPADPFVLQSAASQLEGSGSDVSQAPAVEATGL